MAGMQPRWESSCSACNLSRMLAVFDADTIASLSAFASTAAAAILALDATKLLLLLLLLGSEAEVKIS